MRLALRHHASNAPRTSLLVGGIVCIATLVVVNVAYWMTVGVAGGDKRSLLSNRGSCKLVEIHFPTSALDYVCPEHRRSGLLDGDELNRLGSLQKIVMDDPQRVSAISSILRSASYKEGIRTRTRFRPKEFRLICYGDDASSVSLRVLVDPGDVLVLIGNTGVFELEPASVHLRVLLSEVWPFLARTRCAGSISAIGQNLDRMVTPDPEVLPPERWCDAVVRYLQADAVDEEMIAATFQCYSAPDGRCHYALNADWGFGFPPDRVQLFETEAGWNQYGGPELFTFDNHDPRGGCVLLNDGTVKFIRTEEELHALRWK